jgi:hypothetical protein
MQIWNLVSSNGINAVRLRCNWRFILVYVTHNTEVKPAREQNQYHFHNLDHHAMDTTLDRTSHPQIVGSFAVYTQNPDLARKVLDQVRASHLQAVPFGTVTLDTGEQIDWVNIPYEVKPQ